MKLKFLLFGIFGSFVFGSCFTSIMDFSDEQLQAATFHARKLHESGIVIRVPTQSSKLRYLKKSLSERNPTDPKTAPLKKLLDKTIAENNAYFNILHTGFKTFYTSSSVYYVPDSLYKQFMAGKRNVFIGDDNVLDSGIHPELKKYFLVLYQEPVEKLLLVDQDGNKMEKPFPYSKNMFLPAFRRIINRRSYVHSQIEWFDEKLQILLNHKK